jgi:hypothetical protein
MENSWQSEKRFFDKRTELLQIPAPLIKEFRGALLTNATFSVPYGNKEAVTRLKCAAIDVAIGSDYIIGTWSVPAKKNSVGTYKIMQEHDKSVVIEESTLRKSLTTMGMKNFYFQYDAENAQLYIHFYYQK